MGIEFELEGETSWVTPVYRSGGYDLDVDGRRVAVSLAKDHDGGCVLDFDGTPHTIWIAQHGGEIFVHHAGRTHRIVAINSLERAAREASEAAGSDAIAAPMPGVVVEVAVEVGARVERGALLLTIESMKLQTPILAPHEGRVDEVAFAAGQSFDKGVVLVRLGTGDAGEGGNRS
jgi:biotin carboxyl carrier protein